MKRKSIWKSYMRPRLFLVTGRVVIEWKVPLCSFSIVFEKPFASANTYHNTQFSRHAHHKDNRFRILRLLNASLPTVSLKLTFQFTEFKHELPFHQFSHHDTPYMFKCCSFNSTSCKPRVALLLVIQILLFNIIETNHFDQYSWNPLCY